MFGSNFFANIEPRVHHAIGKCLSRGIDTRAINEMEYDELMYWARWHDIFAEEEERVANENKRVK